MLRAVICDDERASLNIIRHFVELENLPIQIVGTAENGRDAYRLIEKENPDLAFLDINMSYLNGLEVAQKLPDTKVILITAYDSFEHAQKALRLGVCDILAKPIDMEQLRSAIARAVGWRFTGSDGVNTVLAYLYGHFRERVELSTLAGLAYCSESHIAREFKRHTGMSILSYVHKLRVEESKRLLEGQTTVQDAAQAVGYQNLNHFYQYFKQFTEMTPAEYKRRKESGD